VSGVPYPLKRPDRLYQPANRRAVSAAGSISVAATRGDPSDLLEGIAKVLGLSMFYPVYKESSDDVHWGLGALVDGMTGR
jgi:hypothetical protein